MSWLKVDDCILSHPKFIRAREGSDLAYETWTALLCWSKRNLTDGIVPGDALAYLEGTRSPQKRAAAIRALVDAGLLERLPCGGVRLHDYLDWNDSAETVKARRKEDSERKRRPAASLTSKATQVRPELDDSSALARRERGASSEPARQERDISDDSARNAAQANTRTYAEIPDGIQPSETETETETETDPGNTSNSAAPSHDQPDLFDASDGGADSEPKTSEPRDNTAQIVAELFEHWKAKLDHPRSKLDDKRAKIIRARLKDFSADELRKAIDGCAASDWHTGRDPKTAGKRFDGIDLIFRDAAHVETFLERAEGNSPAVRPAKPICNRAFNNHPTPQPRERSFDEAMRNFR